MLIYLQFNLPRVQNWLSRKPFPWLGSISIGLFVVHTPVNALICSSVYSMLLKAIPKTASAFICFFISFGICVAFSWLLKAAHEHMLKIFSKKAARIKNFHLILRWKFFCIESIEFRY